MSHDVWRISKRGFGTKKAQPLNFITNSVYESFQRSTDLKKYETLLFIQSKLKAYGITKNTKALLFHSNKKTILFR